MHPDRLAVIRQWTDPKKDYFDAAKEEGKGPWYVVCQELIEHLDGLEDVAEKALAAVGTGQARINYLHAHYDELQTAMTGAREALVGLHSLASLNAHHQQPRASEMLYLIDRALGAVPEDTSAEQAEPPKPPSGG